MDIDTGALMSSLLIGTIGMGLFIYGKKAERYQCLALGLGLMIYPYFIHSVLWMWVIAAVAIAGSWALARFGSMGSV